MSRPTTKPDLIEAANERFSKLWSLIDTMTEEEQNSLFLFEDRDKNLRDVLVHLYEWHQMVNRWHRIGTIEGGIPEVPGKGYTWRTLPDLNLEIWKKYQDVSLDSSKKMLKESHKMILDLIESHTNDELFSKKVYKWTKSTTLGAYFVSATSSHYDWAMKKIKKHIKSQKNKPS
ncbi:ClbS/DfsB family four-helix bundle protein [Oceanotoga teriensis]|uniref:ClbS/DfsB family four-helix bundle protein n=1 Tax=Oceanotoga teriensis TaxID=515440 RepID=UPI0027134B21|nr:ClbS/DfsB family four-helix bundle protein [Oceanotoga teriensis]MDO7977041.1 ClbS/DfsB family four-helix bundle protein [Oceanotoga teriensis]